MDTLRGIIRQYLDRPCPEAIAWLAGDMRERFGDAVDAVIFYGSCLRKRDPLDGVADVYVVVSSYREAYGSRRAALLAALLPPTVGYVETSRPTGRLRAKYAVISMRDFRRGTSGRWFLPYLWGRFAQPCVLAYARGEEESRVVAECMASACRTLLGRTLALAEPSTAADLWINALELSYGTELRPESGLRARELVSSDLDYYRQVTDALAPVLALGRSPAGDRTAWSPETSPWRRRKARFTWAVRRITGKLLSPLRWIKALATFEGGLDYAAWKLERHTGRPVEVPDRVRRRPWLYVWGELWRLYRAGILR